MRLLRLPVVLRYLVFFLPVLIVSFAVLMGAAAVGRLAGDRIAEWVLQSAALGVALAIAVNVILLVGVLGIKSLIDTDRQRQHNEKMEQMMEWRMRHGGRRNRRRKGGDRKRGRRDRRGPRHDDEGRDD